MTMLFPMPRAELKALGVKLDKANGFSVIDIRGDKVCECKDNQ